MQKALGVESTVGKASLTGAGRRWGAVPGVHSVLTGYSAQREPPADFAPLTAEGRRRGAAIAQSVVVRLPSAAGWTAMSKIAKGR